MLIDTRNQWTAMISSASIYPYSDIQSGATTWLAGPQGTGAGSYCEDMASFFGSGSAAVHQQNQNGFMNCMGSLGLMYVLNTNGAGSITYRTKITNLMDVWPVISSTGTEAPIGDNGGYNTHVPMNSAFLSMLYAYDNIHDDLSSVKISSYDAMMDSWISYIRTEPSSWALNDYGMEMAYSIYRATDTFQIGIDSTCYKVNLLGNDTIYPPAVCDSREAHRDLSSEISDAQLNVDGISGSGSSYAWERVGSIAREKLGKWSGIHVARFTGVDTSYTSAPQMANFYEWLFTFYSTPWGTKTNFGDTAHGQEITRDDFQGLDALYGHHVQLIPNSFLSAGLYSSRARQFANYLVSVSTTPVVYPGELIDYVTVASTSAVITMPVSKVVAHGGAAFWENVAASSMAFAGMLDNCHLTKSDHFHASDFNGLYLAAYGGAMLANVGINADFHVGALGFPAYWHHLNARSGNSVLFGNRNYAQDLGSNDLDNSYHNWNPITPYVGNSDSTALYGGDGIQEYLLDDRLNYATGIATSPYVFHDTTTGAITQILGTNYRNFIFVQPSDGANGYWVIGDEAHSESSSTVNALWHPYSAGAPSTTTANTEWDWTVSTNTVTDTHLSLFLATPPTSVTFSSSPFAGNVQFMGTYLNATYAVDASSNVRALTVIYPSNPSHTKGNMVAISTPGATGVIVVGGGVASDYVMISSPSTTVDLGGVIYKGRVAYVRYIASVFKSFFVRQGTSFDSKESPQKGFLSSTPVSIYMRDYSGSTYAPSSTSVTFYYPNINGVSQDGLPLSGTDNGESYTATISSGAHTISLSTGTVTAGKDVVRGSAVLRGKGVFR